MWVYAPFIRFIKFCVTIQMRKRVIKMQVHKVDNNTSFTALRSFECKKNLHPLLGRAGELMDQRIVKAFNENEYFQELCKKRDVWVSVTPKQDTIIKSGLDVEIYASRINETDLEHRENVINYTTVGFGDYRNNLYIVQDYWEHVADITQKFLKDPTGIKSAIKEFLKQS